MADLNELQSAGATKLVGSDNTGQELNWVNADSGGNMFVIDVATSATGSAVPAKASFIGGKSPTNTLVALNLDASGNLFALPLPTGAATAANQTTMITALQLIDNPVGSATGGAAGTSSYLVGGQYNTALPTLTNTQQASLQLDVNGRVIIAPLTNTSVIKAQLQDNAGNAIASYNSQVQVASILNAGTGVQGNLTIGTSAVVLRVGGSNLTNRKLLTLDNKSNSILYWGYTNAVTTTTGTRILKDERVAWAVGSGQDLYVIAGGAGNTVSVTEGA